MVLSELIFTIAFVLFLIVKFKDTVSKATKGLINESIINKYIINAYFVFTFIYAVTCIGSIYSIISKKAGFDYTYFVGFLLNAMLGMIVLHSLNITLFYVFFSIFIVCILGMLNILIDPNTPSATTTTTPNTWFNLTGWDDFKTKSFEMFNFIFSWDRTTTANSIFTGIGYFIKAIPTFIVWIFYALFSGASAFFGLFSTAQPTSASKAFAQETYFGESVRKTLFYSLSLVLFIIGLIVIVASQEAMRKQPLNVLAVAFVAAFSYLGYIRFFHYESFVSQFMMTLFGLFMIGIYLYNPYNILQNITGTNFTIIFFIFIYLIAMIFIYTFLSDPTDTSPGYKNIGDKYATTIADKFKDSFTKVAYVMIALSIFISMIIWIVGAIGNSQGKTPTAGMYILNALIVIGMLTIVYNSLDMNKILPDNLYLKLIWNIIFYIPCLISDFADLVMSEYYKMKYFTLIIVVLEIIFIIAYWFIYPDIVSKIYTGEGK